MGKRIIWIALCAVIGLALSLTGLTSARTAQNTNSGTTGQNSNGVGGSNTNETGGRNDNRSGNRSDGNQSGNQMGGALASQDRKFAMTAAMSDLFEIEASRLALERAASDHVKQMAQQLIDDHTRTSGELSQLAQTKGLTPPASLDSKHAAMLTRLRGMSGAEFEREYVRVAGVKAHEDAVKLFRDEERKGRDADMRAFATRTLPALEAHLQAARSHAGMTGGHGGHGGGNMNNTNRNSNSNTGNTNNGNR